MIDSDPLSETEKYLVYEMYHDPAIKKQKGFHPLIYLPEDSILNEEMKIKPTFRADWKSI